MEKCRHIYLPQAACQRVNAEPWRWIWGDTAENLESTIYRVVVEQVGRLCHSRDNQFGE